MVTDEPRHTCATEFTPTLAAGNAFTVTVTEFEVLHPVAVTVSVNVYNVVVTGFAVTEEADDEDSAVAGLHE